MSDTAPRLQKFSNGAVVAAHSGRLSCSMMELHALLSYMMDDQLLIHHLPAAADEVRPTLEEAFPWLKDVELPEGGGEDFTKAVQELATAHGALLEVPTHPHSSRRRINPMTGVLDDPGTLPKEHDAEA